MNRSFRVALTTLGCKVNQSETDHYAREFAVAGYACVPFTEPADVYVVNTCTVTHVADKKSRQMIGQARRANPHALVVAIGCYAASSEMLWRGIGRWWCVTETRIAW